MDLAEEEAALERKEGEQAGKEVANDFSKGSVVKNILSIGIPMTLAQLINILYNIVDRMYIGHIPGSDTLPLTGLGLCMPVISAVIAFANLFGMGGAPLCSIARGKGDVEEAEKIMGNSFTMLLSTGLLLTVVGLAFKRPLLYAFGASDATYPFADSYLTIYLLGNVFVMMSLGMNSFINAQGFGRIGMMTTLIGAVLNIILDPVFIFALGMGIQGAAIATVISQAASALWTFSFLTGKRTILHIRLAAMRLKFKRAKEIILLGTAGFMMSITNSIVQVVCNATLSAYGGDLYVGVMTVLNSIREIATMPVHGLNNGSQPVVSFNYGAKRYDRIKTAVRFTSVSCICITFAIWGVLHFFPSFFIRIFNNDAQLVDAAIPALRLYFFGFFMMALQFSGQTVFQALGKAKYAIFFSILRKVVIVTPLTIFLPRVVTPAVNGVFLAEVISNFIGGTACFCTMLYVTWKELGIRIIGSNRQHLDRGGNGRSLDPSGNGHSLDPGGNGRSVDTSGNGHSLDPGGNEQSVDTSSNGHSLDPGNNRQ